jgi:hypothetical protein
MSYCSIKRLDRGEEKRAAALSGKRLAQRDMLYLYRAESEGIRPRELVFSSRKPKSKQMDALLPP